MSKKIFILFGVLFLILFLGNISAEDMCWVEVGGSADCEGNGYKVVMGVSDATNAHGALAGQGGFTNVLCCNFGQGDTTCSSTLDPFTNQPINKILGLSSSTNAHAEAPDLPSPNYNIDVCYDSLKGCSKVDVGFNCAVNEIEVAYISSGETQSYTNAHIEDADLGGSQNYDTKICCVIELPMQCDLTSTEWEDEDGEVWAGADVGTIVNGTGCGGKEISFEIFRGSTSCGDIDGCENPSNVTFGAGSTSMSGTWNASPVHDDEYSFVATVVANPDESEPSSTPNLLVKPVPPGYCSSIAICSQYDDESNCDSNICGIDVQNSVPSSVDCDASGITCECIWEDNECKGSWGGGNGGYCGDDNINTGEQCDGIDWGNITNCSNFDVFTGGTLDCYAAGTSNECLFDTSLCIGPGSYCGDDVVDAGETCDGSDWGNITNCSDFDAFTGGTLDCDNCQFDTSLCTGGTPGVCGDGEINTGEQCDGTNLGPITGCDNFNGFTGGVLTCDTCQFDTSPCTGGYGGYCGNDVIDAGETCDNDWGPISGCSDFDLFTSGTLICGTDCQFDTSDCVGPGTGPEVGTCVYTQYTDDNCDDGFLTFTWTAVWVWDDSCTEESGCRAENAALAAECTDGQKTVECPAQIPLPFFNIYSFIATLVVIAMIYTAIIMSKKKKLKFK